MLKLSLVALFFMVFRPAESLTCYQQLYTPGLTNTLTNTFTNNNPLGNQNQQQQGQQYQNQNFGQLVLPTITCSTTASACYKFVCFGTNSYTARGCLDYTQPQYSCQALDAQCLGGQGQCYTCTGNNCNGALSLRSGSTRLLSLLLSIPIGVYLFKRF